MTIDEKLERLTDRVDAIAQSVELLTTLHRDVEEAAAKATAETAKGFAEVRATMAERFAETLVFINRLAHVAEAHEQRLDELEGK